MAPATSEPDRGSRLAFAVMGVIAVTAGAALTLKPFSSLDALTVYVAAALATAGAVELAGARAPRRWPELAAGLALIAAAIFALAAPDLTVRGVALAAGVGMLIAGGTRCVRVLRGEGGESAVERWTSLVGGLAGVVLGALALAWPDVTILTVAFLVGPLSVVLGAGLLFRAVRPRSANGGSGPGTVRRWAAALLATGGLVLALALVALSALVHEGSPDADDFYDAPAELPSRPGVLLRSEPSDRGVPEHARAERILYTTTDRGGRIAVASGLVLIPDAKAGPLPVLLWEHGTTGVAPDCAPSLLDDPFGAGAMPALPAALSRGWAVVAPDYPGLGAGSRHPYLVGVPEARASLDAVRAARELEGAELSGRTVVWGHSQGGGAALWVGEQGPSYAPDVPLRGVAALAPASDVVALAASLLSNPGGQLFATFVVKGYSDTYPDVSSDEYVRPAARAVVAEAVKRCLSEPATLASVAAVVSGETLFTRGLDTGPLGRRLGENVPSGPTRTPTLIAQGLDDDLVAPAAQAGFVRRLCRQGAAIDYRTYPGRDHVGVVAPDSPLVPQLLRWTEGRLGAKPVARACSVRSGG